MSRANDARYCYPALKLAILGLLAVFPLYGMAAATVAAEAASPAADLLVLHKIRTGAVLPGNLAFVNLASGTVVARVAVGAEPHEVAVSSDGKYAAVTNTGGNAAPGNSLSLIDVAARKEIRRVDLGPMWKPHGIVYRDGRFFFTAEGSRLVGAYDPVSDHVVLIVGTGQDETHNLVFAPDGKTLFTTNRGSNSITMLEFTGDPLAPGKTRSTIIPVCRNPQGLDASPDGKELWVGCRGSNELAVINIAEKKVVSTFPTNTRQIARVRFAPDGKRVITADLGSGEFSIWDAATHQELKRLKLGGSCEGILITPDGKRAFIGVTSDENISEIDLQTMELVRHIPTGQGPDGMAWIGAK